MCRLPWDLGKWELISFDKMPTEASCLSLADCTLDCKLLAAKPGIHGHSI